MIPLTNHDSIGHNVKKPRSLHSLCSISNGSDSSWDFFGTDHFWGSWSQIDKNCLCPPTNLFFFRCYLHHPCLLRQISIWKTINLIPPSHPTTPHAIHSPPCSLNAQRCGDFNINHSAKNHRTWSFPPDILGQNLNKVYIYSIYIYIIWIIMHILCGMDWYGHPSHNRNPKHEHTYISLLKD